MERRMKRDLLDNKPVTGPVSRSVAAAKINQIGCLLTRVWSDRGNSREEDASLLRAIAELAKAAAHDLDPRESDDNKDF